ncbi:hypothetical protein BGZ65_008309 [Modicella reniformis]|uniref:Uncharacterized protein n=1 Tax=Modicella reniformis TaxID=1440133 RepID=A0A9P6IUM4_9FUNG|nr:hypothetical protein BGZ65_008309 [Modicella reniformis]
MSWRETIERLLLTALLSFGLNLPRLTTSILLFVIRIGSNLGTVGRRVNVSRFFHETDARSWHQIELFFTFRDPNLTARDNYVTYTSNLQAIQESDKVTQAIRRRAGYLYRTTKYESFVAEFSRLMLNAENSHAEESIQHLMLNVAQGSGRIRASPTTDVPGIPKGKVARKASTTTPNTKLTPSTRPIFSSKPTSSTKPTTPTKPTITKPTPTIKQTSTTKPTTSTKAAPTKSTRAKTTTTLKPITKGTTTKEEALARRRLRCEEMDSSEFWQLESGTIVETVLQEAIDKNDDNFKIRSFVLDVSCPKTEALFTKADWKLIKNVAASELPRLSASTEQYLSDVRAALLKGVHPATVSVPEDDGFSCNLILRAFLSWLELYGTSPSPFDVGMSEAYWRRMAWPPLNSLLADVIGINMIDGEMTSLEEAKHLNKDRKVDTDDKPQRLQSGGKLDLIARQISKKMDWVVIESPKIWDQKSTKWLFEFDVKIMKHLHLIVQHRLQEVPTPTFRDQARFFAIYAGGEQFSETL